MQGNVKDHVCEWRTTIIFWEYIIFSQGKDISESEDNAAHMQLRSL